MTCWLIAIVLLTAPFIDCRKLLTILSDFKNDKDVEFFKNTLPWVVDRVGSDVSLKFYFNDSGISSGPRQCVLLQLRRNAYMQADYLSCEAKGSSYTECIKFFPINMHYLNICLRSNVKRFVKIAEQEFQKFKSAATPVVIFPRRKIVSDISQNNILNRICALFRFKPVGCNKSSHDKPKSEEKLKPEEPIPEKTPSPDEKVTPEKEVAPEQQTKPEDETKPEIQKQPEKPENAPPKADTKPEEPKQPHEKPTLKPEDQKEANDKTSPETETKPEEQAKPDEKTLGDKLKLEE